MPKRYKDVPKIGQPMERNVEAIKKLKTTNVLRVSTIKDEMLKCVFTEILNKINI